MISSQQAQSYEQQRASNTVRRMHEGTYARGNLRVF